MHPAALACDIAPLLIRIIDGRLWQRLVLRRALHGLILPALRMTIVVVFAPTTEPTLFSANDDSIMFTLPSATLLSRHAREASQDGAQTKQFRNKQPQNAS